MSAPRPTFQDFHRNEDGTIAIIFALVCALLFGAVGLAIDSGRTFAVHSRVTYALEAAALFAAKAGKEQGLAGDELKAATRKFFAANIAAMDAKSSIDVDDLVITFDPVTGVAEVSVDTDVYSTFSAIDSLKKVSFTSAATAVYQIRDVEGALALDVTGSMGGETDPSDPNSNSKIEDLRTASTSLVNLLFDNKSPAQVTRMALVPYSGMVNLGGLAGNVTDPVVTSSDTCVGGRDGSSAYYDDAPGPNAYFISNPATGAALQDVDGKAGNRTYSTGDQCPDPVMTPLTDQRDDLTTAIAGYTPNGYTAGHIGLSWAWNALSPNFSSVWPISAEPNAYDPKQTLKFILLMTDGEFNTAWTNGTDSVDQSEELCTKAKNAGVVIFTVGFGDKFSGPGSNSTKTLLSDCATPPNGEFSQTFFVAKNGAELTAAFGAIARQLNSLRVTG